MSEANRGTGRTTRLVLGYVQEALENVGEEIKVSDHKGPKETFPTTHQSLMVTNKVSAVLTALNVQHYVNGNAVCALPINV